MSEQTAISVKTGRYSYGLGRRKKAVARARVYRNGKGSIIVNGKDIKQYIGNASLLGMVTQPLSVVQQLQEFDITIMVQGGGIKGQAQAMQLAISRALLKYDKELRPTLKPFGLLTTDARVKERKKYGLRKARKAPQYTKR